MTNTAVFPSMNAMQGSTSLETSPPKKSEQNTRFLMQTCKKKKQKNVGKHKNKISEYEVNNLCNEPTSDSII